MTATRIITAFYLIDLGLHLFVDELHIWTKALLIPILIILLFVHKVPAGRSRYFALGALVFSWCGDILIEEASQFLLALVAFLLAHVSYIRLNYNARLEGPHGLNRPQELRYLFIILLAGSAIVFILFPVLGNLKLPVIAYAAVLTFMVISALYRYGRTSATSFALMFGGAVLFMISDTILAFNKFMQPVDNAHIYIMSTYGLAQLFLILGYIQHIKK